MSGSSSREKASKLREARKASGMQETNVWLTREVRQAIGQAIEAGRFPNRTAAIKHALDRTFGDNQ